MLLQVKGKVDLFEDASILSLISKGKQPLSDGVSAMWPLLLKQPPRWGMTHKTRR